MESTQEHAQKDRQELYILVQLIVTHSLSSADICSIMTVAIITVTITPLSKIRRLYEQFLYIAGVYLVASSIFHKYTS